MFSQFCWKLATVELLLRTMDFKKTGQKVFRFLFRRFFATLLQNPTFSVDVQKQNPNASKTSFYNFGKKNRGHFFQILTLPEKSVFISLPFWIAQVTSNFRKKLWTDSLEDKVSDLLKKAAEFFTPLSHTLLLYLCFASQMGLQGFYHNSSLFTSPVTSIHAGVCDDRHCKSVHVTGYARG